MGWILKRKRDLKKLLLGLRRRQESPEARRAREKILAHSKKLDMLLEKKREQALKNPMYHKVAARMKSDKKFREAARMVVESGGDVEAKLNAVEYLKAQGVPELEAYDFADTVAIL